MITIRSSKDSSEPTLIGFEATVTTPGAVYELSSNGPLLDSGSPFAGGVLGPIAWPQIQFRIGSNLVIEQQMFVSSETSDIAISWELRGHPTSVDLTVRPYFANCAPRSYRDTGFRWESEDVGGRLFWLPNVSASKIIADTNGRYNNEPVRSAREIAECSSEALVAPGRFEFQLNAHPSILIFSSDHPNSPTQQFVGRFLANLMPTAIDPATTKKAIQGEQLLAA